MTKEAFLHRFDVILEKIYAGEKVDEGKVLDLLQIALDEGWIKRNQDEKV